MTSNVQNNAVRISETPTVHHIDPAEKPQVDAGDAKPSSRKDGIPMSKVAGDRRQASMLQRASKREEPAATLQRTIATTLHAVVQEGKVSVETGALMAQLRDHLTDKNGTPEFVINTALDAQQLLKAAGTGGEHLGILERATDAFLKNYTAASGGQKDAPSGTDALSTKQKQVNQDSTSSPSPQAGGEPDTNKPLPALPETNANLNTNKPLPALPQTSVEAQDKAASTPASSLSAAEKPAAAQASGSQEGTIVGGRALATAMRRPKPLPKLPEQVQSGHAQAAGTDHKTRPAVPAGPRPMPQASSKADTPPSTQPAQAATPSAKPLSVSEADMAAVHGILDLLGNSPALTPAQQEGVKQHAPNLFTGKDTSAAREATTFFEDLATSLSSLLDKLRSGGKTPNSTAPGNTTSASTTPANTPHANTPHANTPPANTPPANTPPGDLPTGHAALGPQHDIASVLPNSHAGSASATPQPTSSSPPPLPPRPQGAAPASSSPEGAHASAAHPENQSLHDMKAAKEEELKFLREIQELERAISALKLIMQIQQQSMQFARQLIS